MKKVITTATIIAITALSSCGGAEEKVDEAANEVDAKNLYEETLKAEEEIDELNLEIEELNEVEIELDELESELDNI